MPTLEPSREGLTQTGSPSAAARSRQPVLAGLAEVDLGDAALAQQPLEDQLVDRDRRGEDAGADVGDVEALEQPLHGPVLAERSVQDREGDVAAEQAGGGAEVDLGAVVDPATVGLDDDVGDLVAGRPQAIGDGGAGAQRDRMLAGAAAADHGDPHGDPVVEVESVVAPPLGAL